MGVPARPLPARQPGPDTASPPLPAPAPRQGLRHDRRPAPALGPARRAAPLAAGPPVPPAVAAGARAGRALGVPRPGALAARPARPPGGARAGHGPAADGEDRVPGRRDPALPRPGHLHHHEGRRVRPDRRGPRAAGPGARVQPAAHRRRRLDVRVVAGRGVPGPGHRDPTGGRVRVRGLPRGRRGRHVLVIEGERLPARLLPRRRARRLRHARRGRLGVRRRPARPGADLDRGRSAPVGADAGRAPLRGAQDRRHRPDGDVAGPVVHGRPRARRERPAGPGRRVRRRLVRWAGWAPST